MKSILKLAMVLVALTAFGCYYCERNPIGFKPVESTGSQSCVLVYDKPGSYTLDRDVTTDYCAIEITASGVELDLNGHTLRGPSNPNAVSYGILASEKSDVKIKNGSIDGFYYGVLIQSANELNMTISGNQVSGLSVSNSAFRGIYISGRGSLVEYSEVHNSGPSYVHPDVYSFGIEVYGENCMVSNNRVTETYASTSPGIRIGEAVAISFSLKNNGCIAQNNVIYNSRAVTNKSTFGFWVDVNSHVTIRHNQVSGMHYSGIVPTWTNLINNVVEKPMAHGIYDRN